MTDGAPEDPNDHTPPIPELDAPELTWPKCLQCNGNLPNYDARYAAAYGYPPEEGKAGASPFCSKECLETYRNEH